MEWSSERREGREFAEGGADSRLCMGRKGRAGSVNTLTVSVSGKRGCLNYDHVGCAAG